MYEAPKLVRYGQFRDLTLQTYDCGLGPHKNLNSFDALFMNGQVVSTDGCPARS
jgi:hypothetical protein